jgi:hypothetical protein
VLSPPATEQPQCVVQPVTTPSSAAEVLEFRRQTESVSERSPDNRSKKQEREKNTAVPPYYLGASAMGLVLAIRRRKSCKGMQRQNIAVNRLCTGNGSTEAE